MTFWYSAATCFLGGGLTILGLMGWHIANGDALGFLAALAGAVFVWLAGNSLVQGRDRLYGAFVFIAAAAVSVSTILVGV